MAKRFQRAPSRRIAGRGQTGVIAGDRVDATNNCCERSPSGLGTKCETCGPAPPQSRASVIGLPDKGSTSVKTRQVEIPEWAKPLIVILWVLVTLAVLVAFGVLFWGDEYASPPWDERSVPAPIEY